MPRSGRGGGLGIVAKSHINIKQRPPQLFESFESAEVYLRAANMSMLLVAVYRLPPSMQNGLSRHQFVNEFTPVLEDLAISQDNFSIVGDFNIHMDNLENPEAVQCANLLNDCNCIQHVNQPTHMAGHILVVIIIKSCCELLDPKDILIGSFISDHAAVHFCCRLAEPSHNTRDKKFRKLRSVDIPSFLDDIETSLNQQDFGNETDANHLANCYDTTVKYTLDKYAPMKIVRVPDREPVPWYTNDLRQQKQQARRAERRWRTSGLTVDRKEFTNQRNIFTHMASLAKKGHIKKKVEDCGGDQKLLFRLVNELLGRSKSTKLPTNDDS